MRKINVGNYICIFTKNIGTNKYLNMRLNFNTIIYPIYGFCVGVNYWDSAMDHVVLESEVENQTEHCLEFHFGIFAISFVWYSN